MNTPFSAMEPLVQIPRDATNAMIQRAGLMAKPCEFFAPFFSGRIPSLHEKLVWIEGAIQRMTPAQIFQNSLYVVETAVDFPFIRLSIRRHDRGPCDRWDHLQQIKNEVVGPEYEAVELFPAEQRLVDTCNEYHLWVHSSPAFRFPFGFEAADARQSSASPAEFPHASAVGIKEAA